MGGTDARNAITLAHQLEHHWFGLFGQGAIAKCRAYDRSRAGVEYVTKCLSQGTLGAKEYELRKFNLADTVTLSRSVILVIEEPMSGLVWLGADAARDAYALFSPDVWLSANRSRSVGLGHCSGRGAIPAPP